MPHTRKRSLNFWNRRKHCETLSHEIRLPANSSDDGVLRKHHRACARLRPAEPSEQNPDGKGVNDQTHAHLSGQHRNHNDAVGEQVVFGSVADSRHGLQREDKCFEDGVQVQVTPYEVRDCPVPQREQENNGDILGRANGATRGGGMRFSKTMYRGRTSFEFC